MGEQHGGEDMTNEWIDNHEIKNNSKFAEKGKNKTLDNCEDEQIEYEMQQAEHEAEEAAAYAEQEAMEMEMAEAEAYEAEMAAMEYEMSCGGEWE